MVFLIQNIYFLEPKTISSDKEDIGFDLIHIQ